MPVFGDMRELKKLGRKNTAVRFVTALAVLTFVGGGVAGWVTLFLVHWYVGIATWACTLVLSYLLVRLAKRMVFKVLESTNYKEVGAEIGDAAGRVMGGLMKGLLGDESGPTLFPGSSSRTHGAQNDGESEHKPGTDE